MVKALVMDHLGEFIELIRIPENVSDVENYIFDTLGYNKDSVSWMSCNHDISVFEYGEECPITTL